MAFISSAMGLIGEVGSSSAWLYRVSKAALNMAVKSAQASYPGATLVCLHPGWVQTDMGGSGAPVTAVQSAAGMRRVMAAVTPQDQGAFFSYDGQRASTW